ncbi:CDP-alcohol phosphatidyltransferase [Roseivirga sp. 4D4]|uniref:CDP-alcohol phosphatidyltransferase family protein n=1 Tax=Roseivirga sp. 4D4 TaxID=1889784 RepID=UPI000853DC9D|nr:CDP-alcohol phosphatidyltransferase family protein [Roseivirga sp. 4D4]OEK00738.1 CDP-alcohol phosphatidyltransferase [Roseivirga sp. 4D4]
MSKLPQSFQFLDLSDYGRSIARLIANGLKNTRFTPIHVTIGFIISGILAIFCMFNGNYWAAAFFLIFKSILDAADGELARIKKTPSYTGRYFDSIADIILNFLFLTAIWYITEEHIGFALLAFMLIQLQGTMYNYYYVILRNQQNGDKTSRVMEDHAPTALPGEKQKHVDLLYRIYNTLYIVFDKTIYWLDKKALDNKPLPKWFMTALSTFGLGFQLLIISVMLVSGWIDFIIPFFIGYSFMILVFVGIRRGFLN